MLRLTLIFLVLTHTFFLRMEVERTAKLGGRSLKRDLTCFFDIGAAGDGGRDCRGGVRMGRPSTKMLKFSAFYF